MANRLLSRFVYSVTSMTGMALYIMELTLASKTVGGMYLLKSVGSRKAVNSVKSKWFTPSLHIGILGVIATSGAFF